VRASKIVNGGSVKRSATGPLAFGLIVSPKRSVPYKSSSVIVCSYVFALRMQAMPNTSFQATAYGRA
jgi:hypothetical protein